ncbi:exosome complex component MTR3-like isoform X3 [Periplaneta americana]|uniref:exosome complex component MTR3-like isoform X3 n=1 Tax=Periplaneta americana TaxID=6978 RepID=UPI0037E87191
MDIDMKTGVVSQAKGSAYIEQNNTKVICSVFDPREIPRKSDYSVNGELYCEFRFAPFSCMKWRGHQADSYEKECSLILRRALEPAVCRHEFPNFQVDVYALVLENDGSALAAAITCAGLALADASVPMYDLVVATSVGIHGDMKFLDPTVEEESLCNMLPPDGKSRNHGIITAAFSPAHQQMSEFAQSGAMDIDCVTSSIQLLTETCESVYPLSQQCLLKSVTKMLKKKQKETQLNLSSDRIAL